MLAWATVCCVNVCVDIDRRISTDKIVHTVSWLKRTCMYLEGRSRKNSAMVGQSNACCMARRHSCITVELRTQSECEPNLK